MYYYMDSRSSNLWTVQRCLLVCGVRRKKYPRLAGQKYGRSEEDENTGCRSFGKIRSSQQLVRTGEYKKGEGNSSKAGLARHMTWRVCHSRPESLR